MQSSERGLGDKTGKDIILVLCSEEFLPSWNPVSFSLWREVIIVAFSHWKVFFVLQKPHTAPWNHKGMASHFRSRMEPALSTQTFDNPCFCQMLSELSMKAMKDSSFA